MSTTTATDVLPLVGDSKTEITGTPATANTAQCKVTTSEPSDTPAPMVGPAEEQVPNNNESKPASDPPNRHKKKRSRAAANKRTPQLPHSQKEDAATLTRVAALLGQIKEACLNEEVCSKVAPLIESATRMIETLSEFHQKERVTKSSTTVTRPSGTSESGVVAGESVASGAIGPGTKIPTHVYRPTAQQRLFHVQRQQHVWTQQPYHMTGRNFLGLAAAQSMMNGSAGYTGRRSPQHSFPMMPNQQKEAQAIWKEKMKLDLRSRMRQASSISEFETLVQKAADLGLRDEHQAAKKHLEKLKSEQASTGGGAAE